MKTLIIILIFTVSLTNLFGQSHLTLDSIGKTLKVKFSLSQYDKVYHIMSFNNDTILVSGYLSDNSVYNAPKNVVFQTFDGGKTWRKIYFKGDAWIYTTHFEKDGKVWMGGSDEYVHYSNDFGSTWAVKQKPFNPINRVLSIYMTDSLSGIAGGLNNGLATTNDNWSTSKQIPSPLDQNKFSITKNSARNRIDKVQILDSIILINQNDHIYYSKINPIDWRVFNVPVSGFSVNQLKKTIDIFSIGYKVYVLDSKMNQLATYVKNEDVWLDPPKQEDKIELTSFLSSNIKLTSIKATKFDFDKMSGGCMPFALYKENSKGLRIKHSESFAALTDILANCEEYRRPLVRSFKFSEQDLADYFNYYNKQKEKREEEKVWGGDFSYLVNIDDDLFLHPKRTIDSLSQQLLDTVYKYYSYNLFAFSDNEPYIIVNVVNNKSDTLKIASKKANLFSLPWIIEYKGKSFETYDTRITELLKSNLPKGFNYYDNLFAGELIYRLIEQRIIEETSYKNGY